MKTQTTKFSDLQLELLKIYSFTSSEKELTDIKTMLAKYYSSRLTKMVDTAVSNKGLTQETIDSWLNEKK